MKAKVFRQILKGSYIKGNILIYDFGAFKIIERKALWMTPALADPLQTLPSEERKIAIRWLKKKGITMWIWSSRVWEKMRKKFNVKIKGEN